MGVELRIDHVVVHEHVYEWRAAIPGVQDMPMVLQAAARAPHDRQMQSGQLVVEAAFAQ
jgi:hypothetical protein